MEKNLSCLNLDVLRRANVTRLPTFRNANGDPAHAKPDGSDWKLSAWSNAVCGELEEAANIIKKIERGDFHLDLSREALADELADVLIYLDLLAFQAGIDLGAATVSKFNKTSIKVGSEVRLAAGGHLIDAREVTHGDFIATASLAQMFKTVARNSRNWEKLPPHRREALEQQFTKIARALEGDHAHPDHWDDNAGYADLCSRAQDRRRA